MLIDTIVRMQNGVIDARDKSDIESMLAGNLVSHGYEDCVLSGIQSLREKMESFALSDQVQTRVAVKVDNDFNIHCR